MKFVPRRGMPFVERPSVRDSGSCGMPFVEPPAVRKSGSCRAPSVLTTGAARRESLEAPAGRRETSDRGALEALSWTVRFAVVVTAAFALTGCPSLTRQAELPPSVDRAEALIRQGDQAGAARIFEALAAQWVERVVDFTMRLRNRAARVCRSRCSWVDRQR